MKTKTIVTIDREAGYKDNEKQSLGLLSILDSEGCSKWGCHTLELAWRNNKVRVSCIPEGTYKVTRRWSNKYKWHWHIQGVDGRTYILIHPGNFFYQILGCILVGKSHTDIDGDGLRDVTSSKATMAELNRQLAGVQQFELQIREAA